MSLALNIAAFTGISREIRCDLGEGDKARGGKLVAGGVFSLYYHFLCNEYFHYTIIFSAKSIFQTFFYHFLCIEYFPETF